MQRNAAEYVSSRALVGRQEDGRQEDGVGFYAPARPPPRRTAHTAGGQDRRRARLEAWAAGSLGKARARSLGPAWREAQERGLDGLVADAEEEVRRMAACACGCFTRKDLYLLRPPK